MVTAVIGTQWGDEGKGKFVDFLAEKADVVVRFNGGNNAGHTVINKYGKFPFHIIPSGIFRPSAKCLISNGVVIDLPVLVSEIKMVQKAGIKTKGRLFISPRAHLIMPYHKILDGLYEQAKGGAKTGTTGSGIGPCYGDKVSYNGIRIYDLLNPKQFAQKLKLQLMIKNKIIKSFGGKVLDFNQINKQFNKLRRGIAPYVVELTPILEKATEQNKEILYEGAQGFFLDNDWGTYPFVTASSIVPGSANAASGLPVFPKRVLAVAKAYTTRVGSGPFPTELNNAIGEKMRKVGGEFGATTGRPRRCGWLDLELVKTSCRLAGATEIILTKLDVLDGFKKIKVAVGYKLNGKKVGYLDGDAYFLAKVSPIYKELPGWDEKTTNLRKFSDLPKNARAYVSFIEKFIGVPIKFVSVGPRREETIVR